MNRVELLQAWLALEHEATWLYGVIGGRVDDLDDRARRAWNRHRDARDALIAVLHAAGAQPVPAAFGYEPTQIDSTERASAAAQSVEDRIASACMATLASATDRKRALDGLLASATEAVAWGASPHAFPGLD
jgi:hypothetical protein